jgi:hypothetical protein
VKPSDATDPSNELYDDGMFYIYINIRFEINFFFIEEDNRMEECVYYVTHYAPTAKALEFLGNNYGHCYISLY